MHIMSLAIMYSATKTHGRATLQCDKPSNKNHSWQSLSCPPYISTILTASLNFSSGIVTSRNFHI